MDTILQLLIGGIAMGFIYVLAAIEYTLTWNSTGLLNFSHDKIITVGVYIFAAIFIIKFNMNKPLAIISIFILMRILGSIIASGIFNPLRYMRSNTFAIIGTVMLGRILTEAIRLMYGSVPFTTKNWLNGIIETGTLTVIKTNVIICVVAILVVAVLQLFMNFTKIGKVMRCAAQDKEAVALMGINVAQNTCATTAISSIICSVIGMLVVPLLNISATMVAGIGFKDFSAGVIGEFGCLPGATLGGLFIGVVESLAVVVLPTVYKDIMSSIPLIIFPPVRPSGFLGKKARRE